MQVVSTFFVNPSRLLPKIAQNKRLHMFHPPFRRCQWPSPRRVSSVACWRCCSTAWPATRAPSTCSIASPHRGRWCQRLDYWTSYSCTLFQDLILVLSIWVSFLSACVVSWTAVWRGNGAMCRSVFAVVKELQQQHKHHQGPRQRLPLPAHEAKLWDRQRKCCWRN